MSSKPALAVLCLASLICGCEDTPTTAPVTESQAIVGQVISQEYDIEVSAWQAHQIRSTIADSAGYFKLDELPVGLYEVRLLTPSGRHLTIRNVTVETDRTTSLKEIRLSPPSWPLYDVVPHDGAVGVQPLSSPFRITSTMPLDLLSLQASVSFAPPIQGTWQPYDSRIVIFPLASASYYYYDFERTSALEVATLYTLRIGPGLAVAGGQAWNDSLVSVFTTDSLRLVRLGPVTSSGSSPGLVQPRRDFLLYAQFNALVDPDSLTVATSFTPLIEGVWITDQYYLSTGMLRFFNTGDAGLRAEQTYVLHIDGDVPLVGPSTASGDLDVPFQTEALRVINSSPRQGEMNHCPSCGIALYFNSEMDTASLAAAFSLQTLQGVPVAGTLVSNPTDEVYFNPDSVLTAEVVYVARLSTVAANLWGDRLKEPFELYFRVR